MADKDVYEPKTLDNVGARENGFTKRMKKRKLKELTPEEQAQIVQKYHQQFESPQLIAAEFRISASLVGRLAKRYTRDPKFLEIARID